VVTAAGDQVDLALALGSLDVSDFHAIAAAVLDVVSTVTITTHVERDWHCLVLWLDLICRRRCKG
jgi:hypothetical protein